jgi:hypothetical protein
MSQFINPRSAEQPPRFLSSFGGVCSNRGYGYHGGDPVTQSYYHVKWFDKPCFAPSEWLGFWQAEEGARCWGLAVCVLLVPAVFV